MKVNRTLIILGMAAAGLLVLGGTAAAATVKQPEEGEDGGDTGGEGQEPIDDLPEPPPPVPPTTTDPGDPPNTGNKAMLDGYFGNAAGIARALYLLGFGNTSAQMASDLDAEFADADKDDDLAFVRAFQKSYNDLADAGRAGVDNVAFGEVPRDLGRLDEDGTMGYRTLAALYNALRYFSPGVVWNLTTARVKGTDPIVTGDRSNMRGFVSSL